MSSKYSSLPDIDTAPDIYESPDVTTPQVNLRKIVEDKPSEHIIADDIDIKKNAQLFKDKTGETSEKEDTLNLHTKKLLKKYQLETFLETDEYEILDKGSNLKETPLQKIRRLLFEVDSLQEEINDTDKEGEPNDQNHSALVSMISSIQQQLNKISSKVPSGSSNNKQTSTGSILLNQIKSLDELKEGTEKVSIKSSSKGSKDEWESSYALELESRLARLEKTLGSNLITKSEMSENLGIGQSITQMEEMMKILSHPDHMESTTKKVKTLNGELDRLVELKDSLDANNKDDLYFGLNSSGVQPDAETESKLNKLFDLYEKLDSYMLLAPGILNRLQTLNGIHNEAIGAVDSIKALTNDQTRLQNILDVTKEQTSQLETSFNENHQTIKTNMELLDARIKDLITRINKLSPE